VDAEVSADGETRWLGVAHTRRDASSALYHLHCWQLVITCDKNEGN